MDRDVPLLFTENETNTRRLWGHDGPTHFVKDGINDYIVQGRQDTVNPDRTGTKCSAHYQLAVEPGQSRSVRLRLTDAKPAASAKQAECLQCFQTQFPQVMTLRQQECDDFYESITPALLEEDRRNVMRQALAGIHILTVVPLAIRQPE